MTCDVDSRQGCVHDGFHHCVLQCIGVGKMQRVSMCIDKCIVRISLRSRSQRRVRKASSISVRACVYSRLLSHFADAALLVDGGSASMKTVSFNGGTGTSCGVMLQQSAQVVINKALFTNRV
jgi:hypothetical protein